MGLFDNLRSGMKVLDEITFPQSGNSLVWGSAANIDWNSLSDPSVMYDAAIVEATLSVLTNSFVEAVPRVYRRENQQDMEVDGSPLAAVFSRPNPHMTWTMLGAYLIWSMYVEGDAYLAKVRGEVTGNVMELWPLMPQHVNPVASTSEFITRYDYNPNGNVQRIDPEDMVHLRLRMDPNDGRHGVAPIGKILRELMTDDEASTFSTALLKNMGVPGVILSPTEADDPGPDEDEAKRIESRYMDKFGGTRRGRPLILSSMKVSVVSWSPQQMDLKTLRRVPEERIAAVTGVPAVLAQLGAGLDRPFQANVRELREFFTETTVAPLWRNMSEQMTIQLIDADDDSFIRFDTSDVRAYADDENEMATRWIGMAGGPVASIEEARRALGLPVEDGDEHWWKPGSVSVSNPLMADPTPMEPPPNAPPLPPPPAASLVDEEVGERGYAGLALKGRAETERVMDRFNSLYEKRLLAFFDEAYKEWDDRTRDVADMTDTLWDVLDENKLTDILTALNLAATAAVANVDPTKMAKAELMPATNIDLGLRHHVERQTAQRVKGISEWTRTRVRNAVDRGVTEGKAVDEIKTDVSRFLKGDQNGRAATIARTEVTSAVNGAKQYAAERDPRPMWKIWEVTSANPRDAHIAADGMEVLDYEYFQVGKSFLKHPGDPSGYVEDIVNCQCIVSYRLARGYLR